MRGRAVSIPYIFGELLGAGSGTNASPGGFLRRYRSRPESKICYHEQPTLTCGDGWFLYPKYSVNSARRGGGCYAGLLWRHRLLLSRQPSKSSCQERADSACSATNVKVSHASAIVFQLRPMGWGRDGEGAFLTAARATASNADLPPPALRGPSSPRYEVRLSPRRTRQKYRKADS